MHMLHPGYVKNSLHPLPKLKSKKKKKKGGGGYFPGG